MEAENLNEKVLAVESRSPRVDIDTNGFRDNFLNLDDRSMPKNWPATRKWSTVCIMSIMTLVVSLSTLMCAPAAPMILEEFSSSNPLYQTLLVSIWELGEAFGPICSAPLSEAFGRAPVYHTANILFCVFSMACAVSSSIGMLITFRFFNGLAVASIVLNPSIIGDMFVVKERGAAMSFLTLAPLLGPVIGPVIGGYASKRLGWRWLFWLSAIFAGLVEALFLVVFRESYEPKLVQRQQVSTEGPLSVNAPKSKEAKDQSKTKGWVVVLTRPIVMLFASPAIFLLSSFVAMIFAYTYVVFTTITEIFQSIYEFSTDSAGLAFLGTGIGFIVGMLLCRFSLDSYVKKKKRSGNVKPEHRLPPMVLAGALVPIGLLIYGWSAQYHVHWIVPILGTAILSIGVASTLITASTYLALHGGKNVPKLVHGPPPPN